ncbi:MAG: FeoB-associated Cys-rich membrane protein [Oscillospiraceae bacterium]|jgi:hypothetical protein|nr:FeoB-associated Cys-rich membrane protein [Oscillospiraceae bacterium]
MIPTIIITAVIVVYVGWVIFRQIKRAKAGKCGGGCSCCGKAESCEK